MQNTKSMASILIEAQREFTKTGKSELGMLMSDAGSGWAQIKREFKIYEQAMSEANASFLRLQDLINNPPQA